MDGLIIAQPGDKFYAECYVRVHASVATPKTIIMYMRASNSVTGAITSFPSAAVTPTSTGWTKVSNEYTIPAGYDRFLAYLSIGSPVVVGDVYYLDDMLIKEVTPQRDLASAITAAMGTTGNLASNVQTALAAIPGGNIASAILASIVPNLDATKITSGSFGTSLIPGLDAAKITSGSFLDSLIPGLDASKIISGFFPQGMLDITDIPSSLISGLLGAGQISDLDASKITSGQFPQSMLNITSIAAGIISGALGVGNIPALDASKITSGSFAYSMIPGLTTDLNNRVLASSWNSGISKGSNLVVDPQMTNSTIWTYSGMTNTAAVYSNEDSHSPATASG